MTTLLALAVSLGCTTPDAPVDSDPQGVDTGPHVFTGLDAELTYITRFGDAVECDAVLSLVGTPFDDDCESCEYAFSIQMTVIEDNSSGACDLDPFLAFTDGIYTHHTDSYALTEPTLAYADSIDDYENVFMSGHEWAEQLPSGDDPLGRYWFPIAYKGSTEGAYYREGDEIVWSYFAHEPEAYRYANVAEACEAEVEAEALTEAAFSATGSVSCEPAVEDVWTLQVEAGATLQVTVDTVSEQTTFDPAVWLNDPAAESCMLGFDDDSFDCTFEPDRYGCPAMEIVAGSDTVEIVVAPMSNCAGDVAEYRLLVDAEGAVEGTLTGDDVDMFLVDTQETDLLGRGTLEWE